MVSLDAPSYSRTQADAHFATLTMQAKLLTPVADRARPPFNSTGNVPATPISNGTNLGGTSREQIIIEQTCHGLVLDFSSWYNGGNETSAPNDYTIKASIDLNGDETALIPILFGGQPSITMSALAARLRSDPVGVRLTKGQTIWIRTYVSGLTAGQKYQLMRSSRGDTYKEGFNVNPANAGPGTDATMTTFTADASGKTGLRLPGVSNVLATPETPCSTLLCVGDSIPSATGEDATYAGLSAFLDYGWVNRAAHGKWPHVVVGKSGATLADWLNNGGFRSAMRRAFTETMYFTHVINELIINDINAGSSQATVQGLLVEMWTDLATHRRPVYQTTAPPFTSSTDFWCTVAGQSTALPAGQETVRTTINDWIRDGAPLTSGTLAPAATHASGGSIIRAGAVGHPLTGYIEVADQVESARNSGKWKVQANAVVVTDAAITSGQKLLSSPTVTFTSGHVGLLVLVSGAGAAGGTLTSWVQSVSGGVATLVTAASTTVSGATAYVGAQGMTKDGIHPSGDWQTNLGGHATIAAGIASSLSAILGAQAT